MAATQPDDQKNAPLRPTWQLYCHAGLLRAEKGLYQGVVASTTEKFEIENTDVL